MTWFLIFLFLLIGVAAGGLAWFSYSTGTPVASIFFRPRPERRLQVMEQASVDGRRKLIIVRRDNVEHLIMTGGPVDVVIETGIGAPAPRPRLATTDGAEAAAPVYSRPARGLGQAAGE